MTDDTAEEEDYDLKSMLGPGAQPFPERAIKKFKPWHKPRKQYIRRVQWLNDLKHLVKDEEIKKLRYFTLPGNDFLDVWYLTKTLCTPDSGVQLKYYGFNTAASHSASGQPEANNQEFSLKRLECVDEESRIFSGDFRDVGKPKSVPWGKMQGERPFHAINLDLCGGFAATEKDSGLPNYFTALKAVLQHQATSTEGFLLFITTRMDDDNINPDVQAKLNSTAQTIYDTCSRYASEFNEAWGITDQTKNVRVPEKASPSEAFMLGLTQWIVEQGIELRLKALVRTFMTYRTGSTPGADDIVSLAIRFKPDPVVEPDRQGLVKSKVSAEETEKKRFEQSYRIPRKVKRRRLVDKILSSKAEEFEQCVRESSDLLDAAGYDPKDYRKWVGTGMSQKAKP